MWWEKTEEALRVPSGEGDLPFVGEMAFLLLIPFLPLLPGTWDGDRLSLTVAKERSEKQRGWALANANF